MTDSRLPLAELLAKIAPADFLRAGGEALVQLVMEADVEGQNGATRHERIREQLTCRNGFRDLTLDRPLGAPARVDPLRGSTPKLRQGSSFAPFLRPRKSSEKALAAVIQATWTGSVSTRRLSDLVHWPLPIHPPQTLQGHRRGAHALARSPAGR